MMVDKVIEPDSLRGTPGGFNINLRLPWYRSLPLSTVELVSLSVDGQTIAAESIRLALNDGEWRLEQLADQTQQWWYVLDSAQLRVAHAPLQPGSEHAVEVVLAIYPPYIKGLRRMARWTRQMRVH